MIRMSEKRFFYVKKAARAAAFALAAFLFIVYGDYSGGIRTEAAAAGSEAPEDVSMEVIYGYENAAKGNRLLPLHISMEEKSGKAFEGKLQIKLLEADYEVYQYQYHISLAGGEKSRETYYIPIGTKADQIFATLYDGDGNVRIQRTLKININVDMPELFIGVLSDTPKRLQYMDHIGLNYSTLTTRTFYLDESMLPEEAVGLDQLDVLLISNYDSSQLRAEQVTAIKEWVQDGGILLLGAGQSGEKTLSAFAEDILEEELPEAVMTQVDMGVEFASGSPQNSYIQLPCTDVPLKEGNICLSSDELTVLSSVPKKQGIVAVAAYDFVDIEDFCRQYPNYIDKLFTALLGVEKINMMGNYSYGNTGKYYSVQSIINTGDVNRLPDVGLYAIVIVSYVVLVGPGLYFFLKHREISGIYRSGIVMAALVSAGIIYMMGLKTRFVSEFYTYGTIIEASEEGEQETTYMNVRTPYNRPIQVRLKPDYQVTPLTRSYYYEYQKMPGLKADSDYQVSLDFNQESTDISIQNVTAFTPKYFELNRFTENSEQSGFTGQVSTFEGVLNGQITNSTGRDVEDVAVILYGRMALLGDMKAGETKNLSQMPVTYYPLNSYVAAEVICGTAQYEEGDITDQEYVTALERTKLLNFYLSDIMSGYQPGARVVGFYQDEHQDFLLNEPGEASGFCMVTSVLDLNNHQGEMIHRSALQKLPEVQTGNYYAMSNSIYGLTPVILEYYLGNDLEVEKLQFEDTAAQFADMPKYDYLVEFTGNVYFYNYDRGSYDKMDISKKTYLKDELAPYLSPGNTITIKYVYDNSNENNWNILLPMLMVTGREK